MSLCFFTFKSYCYFEKRIQNPNKTRTIPPIIPEISYLPLNSLAICLARIIPTIDMMNVQTIIMETCNHIVVLVEVPA